MDSGSLDVVCGFMVIDEDSRTIVVEGLGGVHGGLSELVAAVGRAVPNGQGYRALENPEVRFAGRLYTSFGTDLKKVRALGLTSDVGFSAANHDMCLFKSCPFAKKFVHAISNFNHHFLFAAALGEVSSMNSAFLRLTESWWMAGVHLSTTLPKSASDDLRAVVVCERSIPPPVERIRCRALHGGYWYMLSPCMYEAKGLRYIHFWELDDSNATLCVIAN